MIVTGPESYRHIPAVEILASTGLGKVGLRHVALGRSDVQLCRKTRPGHTGADITTRFRLHSFSKALLVATWDETTVTFLFCWVPGFKALGPWEALEDDTSENDTMIP